MPFVMMPRCFQDYPLTALPEWMIRALQRRPEWKREWGMAVRLQCYCELTNQTLFGLDDDAISRVLTDFCAAWFSPMFRPPSARDNPWERLHSFRTAWTSSQAPQFPCTVNRASWPPGFLKRVRDFGEMTFDLQRATFWTGWIASNAAGKLNALRLWGFWDRFGPERTGQLFGACRTWLAKGRHTRVPVVEQFADHLVGLDEIDLEDPCSLGTAISDFLPIFFRSGQARGTRLSTLAQQWRCFDDLMSDHLVGQAWPTPLPAIARPRSLRPTGATTNVRTSAKGHAVKIALITHVPLQLTDSQAKELLFKDIRRETDAVMAWARWEVKESQERLNRRRAIAPLGVVSVSSATGVTNGLHYRLSRECPDHLAHAAATFEARGYTHLRSGRETSLIYPEPLAQTSWELGLPSAPLLLAYAAVLVGTHPQITSAFLSELELFDADGKQVGLVHTDAGWYLRGLKRRKGKRVGQQQVLLATETLELVRGLIDITAPLRQWLRERRSPLWRKLFLATPSIGTEPNRWNPSGEASRKGDWIALRLVEFASTQDGIGHCAGAPAWLTDFAVARDLAARFSLKRLRSSAGVLIYLETGSVEAMARALGHEKWRPTLLDRYLPRPIQEFFTERWIRLFQSGIICEALRDSPYLLEASSFATMDELDAFLEHHALRRIPEHLEDPDRIGTRRAAGPTPTRVVFGIEVGILTILLSLEAAVRTACQAPCGRALRWARISERLIPHLEAQTEQPEFRSMVAEARRHIDAQRVAALVYG